MINETPKPVTPASTPAPTPGPQQNQGDGEPNNEKPSGEQQK